MLAPVQRITKVLITSAVNPKAISNQNLCLLLYTSPDLDLNLKLISNLDYLDLYLDLNTDLNINVKLDVKITLNFSLDIKSDAELNIDLDFKAKEILKDIA